MQPDIKDEITLYISSAETERVFTIITVFFPPGTDFSAPTPYFYQNFLQVGRLTEQHHET